MNIQYKGENIMLKIGWSTKDVATNDPVVLPGQFHIRVSKGCLDSMQVCALAIDSGEDFVIFLQCDLVAARGILDEIREKVAKRNPEIDTSKIIINVTHTHCGPLLNKGEDLGSWGTLSTLPHEGVEITPPGEYREFFTNQAAAAICEAYEGRCEGSFGYGYGYAVVAHSRRSVYTRDMSIVDAERSGETAKYINSNRPHGHAKMYGNTNDEYFSHYEAGADHYANFMFTFDENEKLTGAIINIPCPSQNSELEEYMTSDYWGDVRAMLREKYGDIHIMAQCAAAGDLSPRVLHYKAAQNRRYRLKFEDFMPDTRAKYPVELYNRRDIALRICAAFDEVYAWAQKEKFADAVVKHSVKTIELDRRIITDEEYAAAKAEYDAINAEVLEFVTDGTPEENLYTNSRAMCERRRRTRVLNCYEAQKTKKTIPMELHVIRIGDIAFATNTFELYMDYQHRMQARSPFAQTFIVQLCAQPDGFVTGSYLATERGVKNKGYSASQFCNQVSPAGGAQLVEETVAELKKLAD